MRIVLALLLLFVFSNPANAFSKRIYKKDPLSVTENIIDFAQMDVAVFSCPKIHGQGLPMHFELKLMFMKQVGESFYWKIYIRASESFQGKINKDPSLCQETIDKFGLEGKLLAGLVEVK